MEAPCSFFFLPLKSIIVKSWMLNLVVQADCVFFLGFIWNICQWRNCYFFYLFNLYLIQNFSLRSIFCRAALTVPMGNKPTLSDFVSLRQNEKTKAPIHPFPEANLNRICVFSLFCIIAQFDLSPLRSPRRLPLKLQTEFLVLI